MRYDAEIHVTHSELAVTLGVSASQAAEIIRQESGPQSIGEAVIRRSLVAVYKRIEVDLWLASRPESHPYKGEIVPPATPRPLHQQGTYRSSAQMRINQERTAQLYPHRLYTPDGVGNGREFAPGFDQGR